MMIPITEVCGMQTKQMVITDCGAKNSWGGDYFPCFICLTSPYAFACMCLNCCIYLTSKDPPSFILFLVCVCVTVSTCRYFKDIGVVRVKFYCLFFLFHSISGME